MDVNLLRTIGEVMSFLMFIGILVWAFSGARNKLDPQELAPKMRALRMVGVPYTDAEIAAAEKDVAGKNELDAVIAYLQVLGTAIKSRGVPMPAAGTAGAAAAPAAAAAAPAAPVTPNTQR